MGNIKQVCTSKTKEHRDAFKREILEVCRRHGLWISHEDNQGAFLIVEGDDDEGWWLRAGYELTEEL